MAWRFERGETPRDAFLRVAAEEIARVRAALSGAAADRGRAIHDARQGFKRLRALVRLAKPALGDAFAAEDRRWRDLGRALSGARERAVLAQTFDTLIAECGTAVSPRAAATLRRHVCVGDAGLPSAAELDAQIGETLRLLDEAEAQTAGLPWPEDTHDLQQGLAASQRRLRKSWRTAKEDSSPEALHRWRKRVKDQSSQLRLFRAVLPEALRALRADARTTAERLGEEHDLWMLQRHLQQLSLPAGAGTARDRLVSAIEARRADLRRRALQLGKQHSALDPKRFAQSVAAAWEKGASRAVRKAGKASPRSRPAKAPATSRAR